MKQYRMLHLDFNPDPISFNYLLIYFFNNIPKIFKTILKDVLRVNLLNLPFSFESFKFCHHKSFEGTVDPVEAKIWLREIEKTFEMVDVEDDKKTILDAYMLNRMGNYWWEAKLVLEESSVISWSRFKKLFLNKHVP